MSSHYRNGNEQATLHHVTEKNNQLTSNKQLKKSETANVRLIFSLLVRKILHLSNIISKQNIDSHFNYFKFLKQSIFTVKDSVLI